MKAYILSFEKVKKKLVKQHISLIFHNTILNASEKQTSYGNGNTRRIWDIMEYHLHFDFDITVKNVTYVKRKVQSLTTS